MVDKPKSNAVCKKCGRQLTVDEKNSQYCSRCMIEQAEEYAPEAPERPPVKHQRRSRTWLVVQLAIILAAVVIMALQIPRFISAVKGERPLRQGTYATDTQTDQCIANLWHIARLVQEGKAPGKDILCPISKKSYVIKDTGKDVVISCPNPELHGFKEILVSKRRPIPEIGK
jgi:hypothetical protein